jgi:peptidyl-prolyl cis-trans isomerase A (cyclophilin A)
MSSVKSSNAWAEHRSAEDMIRMETNVGDLTLELSETEAPETVKNFLQYVDGKFYDGTIFHRVIEGFMIQGGGLDRELRRKPTRDPIRNEAANGLKNDRGTIAMARTSDPDSATSQFFINVVDNEGLNYPKPDGHGYAVFGKVVGGMDVVDRIKGVKTGIRNDMRDVPLETVEIISVSRAGS